MPIPANVSGESLFLKKPGFERFTALSRFRGMRKTVSGKEELPDLSASEALKSKIHVFDPVRDGDAFRAPVPTPPADAARGPGSRPGMAPENGGAPVVRPPDQAPSSPSAEGRSHPDGEMSVALLFTASEPVEAGDLLALDVAHAGMLARAVSPANTDVVGVVVSVVTWALSLSAAFG